MKALILDAAYTLGDVARAAEEALVAELGARGYEVARRDLAAEPIPDCRGDFGCWTVTPGTCVHAGPHRDLARDVVQADLVVFLTPVTFGGYASPLKRLLDHCIPLVSPFFDTVEGETHHLARYASFPRVLALGLQDRPDRDEEQVFTRLVQRNALNMRTTAATVFVSRDALRDLPARAARWVTAASLALAPVAHREPLPLGPVQPLPEKPPRRALLLVGSPRPSGGVSGAIAAHLAGLLGTRGLQVDTLRVGEALRADPDLRALGAQAWQADVVGLVTPLYVDSLPGPVTAALEVLHRQRADASHVRPRFFAVFNCGFPEASQNDPGLAICRAFASRARLDWIGGLGIGGGGLYAGTPIAEQGGRSRALQQALARVADAVAGGRPVSPHDRPLEAGLGMPAWVYRLVGNLSFRWDARRHGVGGHLGDRPYAR